ncbi:cystathionine beta-synthase [Diaporthe amygdali]|uniref:cystathionine beta-synthase n=1 Tax=Phomopsis amygdali TaxID=1214568 RepID=UPI0022FE5B81|nr:cystathionine beta-synthase [Diaporthe amygdali]KAJ0121143.1 cystathionine beta-synthase [Diaporthe amygdali]
MATGIMAPPSTNTTQANSGPFVSKWASRYRGAAVEDLQPPAALSLTPSDPISLALEAAFERDYTHLTIVDSETRSLMGYISIPNLQSLLDGGKVAAEDPISAAMTRFQRRGRKYKVITMDTPLEELEAFFEGAQTAGQKQEFAVITDDNRRFVLGVATRDDLEQFVKRRPA